MRDYSEEIVTSGLQIAKSPGAQNGARTDSDAPGATRICHTGSTQRALQASLSENHCTRCFGVSLHLHIQKAAYVIS